MTQSIILIHGLFMNSIVMKFMEIKFKKLGYSFYQFNYRTVRYSDKTLEQLDSLVKSIYSDKLYIIGHSMGGLVARMYVDGYHGESHKNISIVTIGTPHHTSRLGIHLNNSIIGKILGSSGHSGIVRKLPDWKNKVPMGCIAGVFPIGVNTFFKGVECNSASDGTVFLDEAIVHNCNDNLVIKSSHTGLIYSKEVVAQCHHFFQYKKFNK